MVRPVTERRKSPQSAMSDPLMCSRACQPISRTRSIERRTASGVVHLPPSLAQMEPGAAHPDGIEALHLPVAQFVPHNADGTEIFSLVQAREPPTRRSGDCGRCRNAACARSRRARIQACAAPAAYRRRSPAAAEMSHRSAADISRRRRKCGTDNRNSSGAASGTGGRVSRSHSGARRFLSMFALSVKPQSRTLRDRPRASQSTQASAAQQFPV